MATKFQSLKGFEDLLPGQVEHWQALESAARELFRCYGFREIRPPLLEATELFVRSVGEVTDIVGKEMFTLQPSPDESVTLRPEITASVCRAYVEHGLDRAGISRLYYIGAAFRKERPQRGRLRQFHQAGVEVIGESAAATDVELIALGMSLVQAAGVTDATLLLNSLGDAEDRVRYRAALVAFLEARRSELSADSQARIERNPLRVLDSKDERDQRIVAAAPSILDHIGDAARVHFDAVVRGLASLGIDAIVDPRLVRGIDYYMRTTFEIQATGGLGSQNTVLGGGRYDNLIEELGGRKTPGIGWAAGIERLLLAGRKDEIQAAPSLDAFVVALGESASSRALSIVQGLRALGVATMWDPAGHGLGGQMKRADRSGARITVLLGDDELARGRATLKVMETGAQSEASLDVVGLARAIRELSRGEGQGTP